MVVGWVKGSKVYYPISQAEDGHLSCPCKGWVFNNKCYHMKDYLAGKFQVKMEYTITFIDSDGVIYKTIEGEPRWDPAQIAFEDVVDNISRTEHFLSMLTGFNVVIEQRVD